MTTTISSQAMPLHPRCRVRAAVPASETSPWIFVNDTATVVVQPSGSMKVQATCSLPTLVEGDNHNATSSAIAFDWTSGTVSAVTAEQVRNVTAVRFVSVSGAGVGEVGT